MTDSGLELKFFGGLGEIGMNSMALMGPDGGVLIDCGVAFPRGSALCPDYLLPDLNHIETLAPRLKALVITHGHEDHIGGVPYLLMRANIPVYAPPFALELIKEKLNEWSIHDAQLNPIRPRQRLELAGFEFEFLRVTHSIPDALGMIIRTSEGNIVHTGDFRIDEDPVRGQPIQLEAFQRAGDEGTLLLMSDSTNVEVPGSSRPEQEVGESLQHLVENWEGRVVVTMFASNIYRMGMLWEISKATGRRLCLVGRSLYNYVRAAQRIGVAPFLIEACVEPSMIERLPDEKLLIVTTGSQGEPRSALAKISADEHPDFTIREGDLVIFSSRIIPGNELDISRLSNGLARLGATVVTARTHNVHASGHAQRDELARILELVRPLYFIPLHGEYRFLLSHAELAQEVTSAEAMVMENGDSVAIRDGEVWKSHTTPLEPMYVEGSLIGTEEELRLKERKRLMFNGTIFCSIRLDPRGMLKDLVVKSQGIPDVFHDLEESLNENARDFINSNWSLSTPVLKEELELSLRREVRRKTGQKPSVLVAVHKFEQ